jgi:hypothetical protein
MVGEEGPVRHPDRIPVSGKNLLVSFFGYSFGVRQWPGRLGP